MILQSLRHYYERKRLSDPLSLPPIGFEENAISFVVVIEEDGAFVNLEDRRIGEGQRKRGKPEFLPQGRDRTGKNSWKTAFLLWDHPRYVFGLPKDKNDEQTAAKRLDVFKRRIRQSFPDSSVDAGVHAVIAFYESENNFKRLQAHDLWSLVTDTNGNVGFCLRNASELVCQSRLVVETVAREFANDPGFGQGQCLVTGNDGPIARLHPATPVPGSQATAKFTAFDDPAFRSYRKERGANAPVSVDAAFQYTTALNYLLSTRNRRAQKRCVHAGDSWVVFWADQTTILEDHFADIFDEPPKDEPDRNIRAIKALYESPKQGVPPIDDGQTRFSILGLAPAKARVAVRFWQMGTVAELAGHIQRHFDDLQIVRRDSDHEFLPLKVLLNAIAPVTKKYPNGDPEKVPPNLGGDVMRAVLCGNAYPETLLQGAVRRIRAEQAKKNDRTGKPMPNVSYSRAALIKACINRQSRNQSNAEKELTVSLDLSNINPGYRLGRLFAVLEKIQEEANPKINATIRDRFYGAASAASITVFSNLMRLKNHHLAKLENAGRRVKFERVITEIVDGIGDFPPHMSLADQGRFAIGYYHQRHALFSKS